MDGNERALIDRLGVTLTRSGCNPPQKRPGPAGEASCATARQLLPHPRPQRSWPRPRVRRGPDGASSRLGWRLILGLCHGSTRLKCRGASTYVLRDSPPRPAAPGSAAAYASPSGPQPTGRRVASHRWAWLPGSRVSVVMACATRVRAGRAQASCAQAAHRTTFGARQDMRRGRTPAGPRRGRGLRPGQPPRTRFGPLGRSCGYSWCGGFRRRPFDRSARSRSLATAPAPSQLVQEVGRQVSFGGPLAGRGGAGLLLDSVAATFGPRVAAHAPLAITAHSAAVAVEGR